MEEEFWRDYDVPEDSAVHFNSIKTPSDYNVELNSTLVLIKEDKEVLI